MTDVERKSKKTQQIERTEFSTNNKMGKEEESMYVLFIIFSYLIL
jgi:hypothetical protein